MNNQHDDDLAARCVEIRSRHHSTWTDYDLDDLASEKQIAALDRMIEKREGRERERLARLETDLQQAVAEINGNVIKTR